MLSLVFNWSSKGWYMVHWYINTYVQATTRTTNQVTKIFIRPCLYEKNKTLIFHPNVRLVSFIAPHLNKPAGRFNWILETDKRMSKVNFWKGFFYTFSTQYFREVPKMMTSLSFGSKSRQFQTLKIRKMLRGWHPCFSIFWKLNLRWKRLELYR